MNSNDTISKLKRVAEILNVTDYVGRGYHVSLGSIASYKSVIIKKMHEIPDEWYLRGACRSESCSGWEHNFEAPEGCLNCWSLNKEEYRRRLETVRKFEL